jgi:hypothetical protein
MKKILALTMFLILFVIGTSLADVPPQNSLLVAAGYIVQSLKAQYAQYNQQFETLIVMEEDYCIVYAWKSPTRFLKIQLPDRGIKMTIPDVSIMPQEVPDLKIIIRIVDVK